MKYLNIIESIKLNSSNCISIAENKSVNDESLEALKISEISQKDDTLSNTSTNDIDNNHNNIEKNKCDKGIVNVLDSTVTASSNSHLAKYAIGSMLVHS